MTQTVKQSFRRAAAAALCVMLCCMAVLSAFAAGGDPVDPVTFIEDFFQFDRIEFARAALNRARNVVFRQTDSLRFVYRRAKTNIFVRIAAALFGRDDNRFRELTPQLAALSVDQSFLMLNTCPMGMP